MDAMHTILQPIESELAIFRKMQDDLAVNPNPLLREIILHVNKQRGKQMRPMMVLLFSKMFGQATDATYSAALALELLHTASLVHDDVVDDSMQRRGQPSVNAIYNNKLAVLVGDYLLSTSLVFTGRCGNPRITTIIGNLGQTLADGEIFQMFHSHEKLVSEEVYLEIIRKKTASLFSACAQVGTILAGGNEDEVERMRRFGQLTGTCFQLRDDIFDFDDKADTGKPAGNDMKEGKLTLPVIHALNKAATPEMTALALAVRRGEATAEQIAELVSFTRQQEGIAYAEWAMDEFRYMASGLIPDNADKDVADALRLYVDYVAQRNK